MDQKTFESIPVRYVLIGVVVAVVIGIGWYLSYGKTSSVSQTKDKGGNTVVVKGGDAFRPDNSSALATVEGGTREQTSGSIKTPEPGDKPSDSNIAVPTSVIGSGPNFRVFSLTASGGKFTPSTIVVNESDVIDVAFSAVDADYDVWLSDFGIYKLIKKGTTEKIQFQAYPYGTYSFVCRDACKGATGKLIVNAR